MHLIKTISGIATLCALLATSAAIPAPALAAGKPVAESGFKSTDKVAIVDVYTAGTCSGSSQQVKQVNGGAECHVFNGQSVEVSARYVDAFFEIYPIYSYHLFFLVLVEWWADRERAVAVPRARSAAKNARGRLSLFRFRAALLSSLTRC